MIGRSGGCSVDLGVEQRIGKSTAPVEVAEAAFWANGRGEIAWERDEILHRFGRVEGSHNHASG